MTHRKIPHPTDRPVSSGGCTSEGTTGSHANPRARGGYALTGAGRPVEDHRHVRTEREGFPATETNTVGANVAGYSGTPSRGGAFLRNPIVDRKVNAVTLIQTPLGARFNHLVLLGLFILQKQRYQ